MTNGSINLDKKCGTDMYVPMSTRPSFEMKTKKHQIAFYEFHFVTSCMAMDCANKIKV
jgi:hypothetical protein